jgi:phage shock protein A
MAIRARNEGESFRAKAADYENKAVLLLQRAHKGDMSPAEADRLASEALLKKAENEAQAARAATDQEKFEHSAAQMDQNVSTLKSTISQWENELKTLKARVTVSTATISINKQLAQLDSSGTVALLERMKEKVAVQEALAESYGEIANTSKSIDAEIDKALGSSGAGKASEDLKALKAKLGYTD